MDKNVKYAAVNTKIAAMCGKLLDEEDYKRMIALSSPSEIAVYLKNNTHYGEFFRDRDASTMHRNEIERILKEGLITYVDKLINYFNGEYRSFLKGFYMKYEIIDLKRIARLISIEKDFDNLKDNLVYAGKYKYIDMDRAVKAKSIKELIYELKGTIYYNSLEGLIDGREDENLYRFEMTLDRAYFAQLEDNVKKLSKSDQQAFYSIIGSYIDMLNLQWIYRGKKYYRLSNEEIFNYTISRGFKFNLTDMKDFCYTKDLEEFVSKAKNTVYAFMFKGDSSQDIFMERRMRRYLYFRYKSAQRKMKLDLSMLLVYLELIEYETQDIISVVENVRYRMDYDEAKKYLIKAI